MNPKDLAELNDADLASWLADRARDARAWVLSESFGDLRDLLILIREAATVSTGTNLQLLEVAEAFVAPLGGRNFGRRELEVQKFLKLAPDAEELLLGALARPLDRSFEAQLPDALRSGVERLVREGVLLRVRSGLAVAPGMVGPVRELLSPPVFRMWAAVEQARSETTEMPLDKAALLIAAKVGVTVDEARRFLNQFPLAGHRRRRASKDAEFVPSPRSDQGPDQPQESAHLRLAEDASLSLERAGSTQRN